MAELAWPWQGHLDTTDTLGLSGTGNLCQTIQCADLDHPFDAVGRQPRQAIYVLSTHSKAGVALLTVAQAGVG